jgi:hypothetical protein
MHSSVRPSPNEKPNRKTNYTSNGGCAPDHKHKRYEKVHHLGTPIIGISGMIGNTLATGAGAGIDTVVALPTTCPN